MKEPSKRPAQSAPAGSNPFEALKGRYPVGAEIPPAPEPPAASRPAPLANSGMVVVRREKKGRAGKTVTRVTGLALRAAELDSLAREMKRALGCGATIEGDDLLLQGAQTERAADWLRARGLTDVRIGELIAGAMETLHSVSPPEPPRATVERWAWDLIHARTLIEKLAPPAPPDAWEPDPPARRLTVPGRPPELRVVARSPRTPRPGALRRAEARARLLHTFLHHEVQAAELFCQALLAFPQTPREFRAGLVRLAREELVHAGLYRAQLERLGARFGDFPVRDWFWERVPTCSNAAQFCALVGIGLEGANLDHAPEFARRFRAAGDEESAVLQERVARDEREHVRFAARWFEHWTGGGFDAWVAALPAPLSPILFRGPQLALGSRVAAGLDEDFVHALERWTAPTPGS